MVIAYIVAIVLASVTADSQPTLVVAESQPKKIPTLVHSFSDTDSAASAKEILAAKELVRLLSLLKGQGSDVVLVRHSLSEVRYFPSMR